MHENREISCTSWLKDRDRVSLSPRSWSFAKLSDNRCARWTTHIVVPRGNRPCKSATEPRGDIGPFSTGTEARDRLVSALTDASFHGAMIAGQGGFGKSALANHTIDELQRSHPFETVIYLSADRQAKIDGFQLFRDIMKAWGKKGDRI